jgi:hypothetical protein
MNRNAHIFSFLLLALAALSGCSSKPSDSEAKKAGPGLQTIQGKAQVLDDFSGDAVLNSGGTPVFLWEGKKRYRLFFRRTAEIADGHEYVVEGINAQKAIDEIGDPDQGKNGYPLPSSCERVLKMAWKTLAFDEVDVKVSVLRTRVARFPARPIILVVRMRPATSADKSAASAESKKEAAEEEEKLPIVAVAADKQRALLIEGPPVQTAPLWEPAGGTVQCKVLIGSDGKISELETGTQLCEIVPWPQVRFQPPVKGGKPVRVRTEVEARFEPRK